MVSRFYLFFLFDVVLLVFIFVFRLACWLPFFKFLSIPECKSACILLGFTTVCNGSLPEPCASILLIEVANCPIYFSNSWRWVSVFWAWRSVFWASCVYCCCNWIWPCCYCVWPITKVFINSSTDILPAVADCWRFWYCWFRCWLYPGGPFITPCEKFWRCWLP